MRFDWWTFALQIVNFAVLVWLLHRFLYKPVLRMIDARRSELEGQRAQANAAAEKAKKALADVEARLAGIDAQRDAVLKAAAAQAEAAAAARRTRAQGEADTLLEAARKTFATEREQALAEARHVALDLGERMARRLLEDASAKPGAEAWLCLVEQRLAALSADEREALLHQLDHGATVTVVTAAELPAEAAAQWREGLRHDFGRDLAVEFAADPRLIGGAELHFPSAVLRLSWQSALASLRSEIEDHGGDAAH